jgi:hypothetical protein
MPSSSISISPTPTPGRSDELADPLGALGVDVADEERRLARVALADRLEQRLGLVAEHREQHEVLLGRGEPSAASRTSSALGGSSSSDGRPPRAARRPPDAGSIGAGGVPYAPVTSCRNSSSTVP